MSIAREWRMRRRDFLQATAVGSIALGFGVSPAAAEDEKAIHNMLVFGEQTVFLSHLPMFHELSDDRTEFVSPHRYQVILEAAFTPEQLDSYVKDRKAHHRYPVLYARPGGVRAEPPVHARRGATADIVHRNGVSWSLGGK